MDEGVVEMYADKDFLSAYLVSWDNMLAGLAGAGLAGTSIAIADGVSRSFLFGDCTNRGASR